MIMLQRAYKSFIGISVAQNKYGSNLKYLQNNILLLQRAYKSFIGLIVAQKYMSKNSIKC